MNTLDIDIIRRISTHQPTRDAYAFRIAETANGNPLGAYVTAGILDWPRDYQTQHPTTKGRQ